MKLLFASISGYLDDSLFLPEEIRPLLCQSALLIASATVLAPRPNPESQILGFEVLEVLDHSKNRLTEQLPITVNGLLGGKFNWLQRMFSGFNLLQQAIDIASTTGHMRAAQELKSILVRLNILLGVIEAIRTQEDELIVATAMADKLQQCLSLFYDFGVIPAGLISKAMVLSLKEERAISNEPEAWEQISKIGYEVWDQADEIAENIKQSNKFSSIISESLACLPYYEAAVALLIESMIGYKTTTQSEPRDLMRDFGVVEEYRVGVLELISYFGHHLISRPCLFLLSLDTGLTISEGVRQVLLAVQSEISVYPNRLLALWGDAANHAGGATEISDKLHWASVYATLENQMEQRFPSAFADSDIASIALQLYQKTQHVSFIDLRSGWGQNIFDSTKPLIREKPVELRNGSYSFPSINENKLLETILGDYYKREKGCE